MRDDFLFMSQIMEINKIKNSMFCRVLVFEFPYDCGGRIKLREGK